jgi:hypothetical protein
VICSGVLRRIRCCNPPVFELVLWRLGLVPRSPTFGAPGRGLSSSSSPSSSCSPCPDPAASACATATPWSVPRSPTHVLAPHACSRSRRGPPTMEATTSTTMAVRRQARPLLRHSRAVLSAVRCPRHRRCCVWCKNSCATGPRRRSGRHGPCASRSWSWPSGLSHCAKHPTHHPATSCCRTVARHTVPRFHHRHPPPPGAHTAPQPSHASSLNFLILQHAPEGARVTLARQRDRQNHIVQNITAEGRDAPTPIVGTVTTYGGGCQAFTRELRHVMWPAKFHPDLTQR